MTLFPMGLFYSSTSSIPSWIITLVYNTSASMVTKMKSFNVSF